MKDILEPTACPLAKVIGSVGYPPIRHEIICLITGFVPRVPELCINNCYPNCPGYARAFWGLNEEKIRTALKEGRPISEILREMVAEELKGLKIRIDCE